MAGLSVWRSALQKGRLPEPSDFRTVPSPDDNNNNNNKESRFSSRTDCCCCCWPPPQLYEAVYRHMAELQLPRLVRRHPELCDAVLRCLVQIVTALQEATLQQQQPEQLEDSLNNHNNSSYSGETLFGNDQLAEPIQEQSSSSSSSVDDDAENFMALLADEMASSMLDEAFGSVVSGVQLLDQLFGYDYSNRNLLLQGAGDAGLQDGVWRHSGWRLLPQLQQQVSRMKELRQLLQQLGRRPTAHDGTTKYHRFAPRVANSQGSMGALIDTTVRSSVSGLTWSNSLVDMLPSEALLLTASSSVSSSSRQKTAAVLRRLFFAKWVEGQLLSYDVSGWTDTSSVPQAKKMPRRAPSAPGGPLIVCLDTSWSMATGPREFLSKAVVVACVMAAHRQKRPCRVVAFSQGVVEAATTDLNATPEGVRRLLDFLSHSFSGGTDVTGALRYALDHILVQPSDDDMTAADLLLITDGEIPPVEERFLQDLQRRQQQTGAQIHGLLVGRNTSAPLEQLCTQTHNFLTQYDNWSLRPSSEHISSTALSMSAENTIPWIDSSFRFGRRYGGLAGRRLPRRPWAGRVLEAKASARKDNRKTRDFDYDDDDDDYNVYAVDSSDIGASSLDEENKISSPDDGKGATSESSQPRTTFNAQVEEVLERVRALATAELEAHSWQVSELDEEKNRESSCWQYRDQFREAIARVNENLVEREQESRLVVLALSAGEHILFLGPPGTAKSALGRRLANICGGLFFQRLLTRFTTPEELFGPLSLRALENDEYRRQTEGFLPKATVAFLDEIFKANSAILNTLLTILNERSFDNGAGNRENCPIRCVIAASNELPESDELDAFFDRFLLRKEVSPVSDEGIVQLLSIPTPGSSPCDGRSTPATKSGCEMVFTDGLDKVVETLSTAADHVVVGRDVSLLLRDLRTFMREEFDNDISDRRLVKIARLLKISAASHGRGSVDPIDCLLLQHVAWRLPEQKSAIREWLWDHITPGTVAGKLSTSSNVVQFTLLLENIRSEAIRVVRKTSGDVIGDYGGRDFDIAVIKSLREDTAQIVTTLQDQAKNLMRHIELLRRSDDHLWLDPDEAQASRQLLLPSAEEYLRETNRVLYHARSLVIILREDHALLPSNSLRLSAIEQLWDPDANESDIIFTEEELNIGMKEAKARLDAETFRKWKRARKKAGNRS